TLHKQGIQAFYPVLVEGNAIRLHPMVCKGFNADFDGDQMAVHVPLSEKAVEEAKAKMFPTSNVLLMADGNPVINVEKDMALGVYYLTGMEDTRQVKFFASKEDALRRFDLNELELRDKIKVLYEGRLLETTVGRMIFNEALPKGFSFINKQLNKGDVAKLSAKILQEYGSVEASDFLNNVENLGFKYATISALNVGMDDFVVSPKKDEMLKNIEEKEDQLTDDYYNGLLTEEERRKLMEKIWMDLIEKVAEDTWNTYLAQSGNNLVVLQESGAVPVQNPLRQISGIRGLILDPLGHIVPLPLRSNYKEGLSPLEYFVAARGTRKGLADTALKTAESGYLTRRLVDVAQDVIIREYDCGAGEGIVVKRGSERRISFEERITGRFTITAATDPKTGEVFAKQDSEITPDLARKIVESGVAEVLVRSVLKCKLHFGVCQKCYGYNLGTKKLVEKGLAVGVIAAQSMGEAATQLTLNTKHLAGRAGTDITQGLPRVEELFEARTPKARAIIAGIDGTVKIVIDADKKPSAIKIISRKKLEKIYILEKGDELITKKGGKVEKDTPLYKNKEGEVIKAIFPGSLKIDKKKLVLTSSHKLEEDYPLTAKDIVVVEDGNKVIKGTPLSIGSVDPKELMDVADLTKAQLYLIDNIQETYGIQGISIDDKHVEVIIRQMSRYCKITGAGESTYLVGSMVDHIEFLEENAKLKVVGKEPAKSIRQLLGITLAAIKTESFLSASSFEQQVRVLSEAALNGKYDYLRGLKENVIIGRTVPLGEELR
ncbi:MAG TPA: DNA-directed RNA polymerase subunit beta', partial [Candidatus Dojkabacteria bacterium]|nr:DNA-directed RNA polymerase subunit beta' [Candidatus Dojkabacteria bacterium]